MLHSALLFLNFGFFKKFLKDHFSSSVNNRCEKAGNGKGTEIMDMGRVVIQNQNLGCCADNKKIQ